MVKKCKKFDPWPQLERWLRDEEGVRAVGALDGELCALRFTFDGDQEFVATGKTAEELVHRLEERKR